NRNDERYTVCNPDPPCFFEQCTLIPVLVWITAKIDRIDPPFSRSHSPDCFTDTNKTTFEHTVVFFEFFHDKTMAFQNLGSNNRIGDEQVWKRSSIPLLEII